MSQIRSLAGKEGRRKQQIEAMASECSVCICPDCRKQNECEICNKCYTCPEDSAKSECPRGAFEE